MADRVELDVVDIRLLRLLQEDGHRTNRELAARAGIATSTCSDRLARLRDLGVVTGSTVRIEPAAVGRPLEAMLAVRVQPHRRPLVDPFVRHVLAQPETRELYHLTGPDDFLVHVTVADAADLQRLVLDELTARPEVVLVHTHLVFQQWRGGPLLPPGEPAEDPVDPGPAAAYREHT